MLQILFFIFLIKKEILYFPEKSSGRIFRSQLILADLEGYSKNTKTDVGRGYKSFVSINQSLACILSAITSLSSVIISTHLPTHRILTRIKKFYFI